MIIQSSMWKVLANEQLEFNPGSSTSNVNMYKVPETVDCEVSSLVPISKSQNKLNTL